MGKHIGLITLNDRRKIPQRRYYSVPPFDAPGVGRMAMVADPSGADFAIIQFAAQD